ARLDVGADGGGGAERDRAAADPGCTRDVVDSGDRDIATESNFIDGDAGAGRQRMRSGAEDQGARAIEGARVRAVAVELQEAVGDVDSAGVVETDLNGEVAGGD